MYNYINNKKVFFIVDSRVVFFFSFLIDPDVV